MDERLAEDADSGAMLDLARGLGSEPVVLCTHQPPIASLLGALAAAGQPPSGGRRTQPTGAWLISRADGLPAIGRYLEPPVRCP